MLPVATVPQSTLDDAALVARLQAGDPDAETALAERFGPRQPWTETKKALEAQHALEDLQYEGLLPR